MSSCKDVELITNYGTYIPQCKADGTYNEKQCHASIGYCWCVDSISGVEIQGTRKGPGQGDVICSTSIILLFFI